ncbi:alanyl (membrane) aminopeptidase a [Simochromis diagramma]|uniref:alanyl (membrane) aminopeptidase a n=1 Tax=Simochromis diagramma TaxID=43689 RepID=UPI001A7E9DB9|nr:alanyl (membrane) aminopeptidase a [Simochromis diagramma]
MPLKFGTSKAIAIAFGVLTVSSIGGMFTMIILFKAQTQNITMTPPPTLPPTSMAPTPDMRLPKSLVPQKYDIVLAVHLYTKIIEEGNGSNPNITTPNQTMIFTGNSTVHFQCAQKTMSIFLNSRYLNVSSPVVLNENTKRNIKVSGMKHHDDESDFLELELMDPLEAGGNYSLFLSFHGEVSDNLEALYLSRYTDGIFDYESVDDPNADRFIAATNLQPTDARKVFPCFDEPDMKAVFKLTIIHRRETRALGNAAPYENNIIDDEWQYTTFRATPKMSTYLFAFAVVDDSFKSIPSPISNTDRVKINTYARPEAINAGHADYASDIARKLLRFYESQFEMKYSMEKIDQLALPDLYPAAMENWGLITYQEGFLLYQEGVSSLLHKEDIATVIAHELAHQWFGNEVTMKWWNDLWLNEGIATYLSYIAVDSVEPTFNIKEISIMNDLHDAFREDALASSHPLSPESKEINTTDHILGMFDSISYSKGAIVLRMLANHVGEVVFNKGLQMYLKAFQYGNVEKDDLLKYMQMAANQNRGNKAVRNPDDIAGFMNPWTTQSGYPVITINTTNGQVYQKQFLFNNSANSSNSWTVEIEFISNASSKFEKVYLYNNKPVNKEAFITKNGDWILANVNCIGYYRVNYNPENWERLLAQLQKNRHSIPLLNRGQLIDDAFNLARAKLVNVTLALNSTLFLTKETEFLPWESAVRNLDYFILMFDRSEVYGPMQTYLREQVRELYNVFKNDTDDDRVPQNDHSLQYTQLLAIKLACSNGLPECVEMAKQKYAAWMESNNTNSIHPNLRSEIYCQAVAAGEKEEWEFAWDMYQTSSNTSEKEQLRRALSCTKKIWLLSRYLDYTLDPEKIRLMDVASTIYYIAQNSAGQALAWNFIRANWDYVSQGDGAMLIAGVTSRFSTEFELEELMRFQNYDLGGASRAVSLAIEQTQVNIQWVKENKDDVLRWFEQKTSSVRQKEY